MIGVPTHLGELVRAFAAREGSVTVEIRAADAGLPATVPELVLLGPQVNAPVQLAQSVKVARPEATVVLIAAAQGHDDLKRALMVSPFLGGDVQTVADDDLREVESVVQQALARARRRRRNSAMVSFAAASLGEAGPSRPRSGLVLDRLMQTAPIGIAVVDATGHVLAWNNGATAVTGRTEREAIGRPAHEAIGAPRLPWDELPSRPRGGDEADPAWEPIEITRAKGTQRHLEIMLAPLADEGSGARALVLFHDVTSRVRAERELADTLATLEERVVERTQEVERQRTFLRTVVDTDPSLVFAKDAEGRFTLANQAVAEVYGTTVEELVGRTDADFNPNEEEVAQFREKDLAIFRTGVAQFVPEEPVTNPVTGETRYFQTIKVPLRDEKGEIHQVLGVATDITERRGAEDELRHYTQVLERANRELEQFAMAVSHDLREPLRMVSSYVQLIARRLGDDLDGDLKDYVAYATEGVARMDRLLADLLAYSQVDVRGPLFKPVDLQRVIDEVMGILAARIEEENATIEVDELPTVSGDRTQLTLVLLNLISNALKFRGEEPPRVRIEAERSDDDWHITVTDNGIGFDQVYADRIFAIFQRLHGRTEFDGTGVGLALCRKAIESHGGRIWAESAPGEGATFHISLPRRPVAQAALARPEPAAGADEL